MRKLVQIIFFASTAAVLLIMALSILPLQKLSGLEGQRVFEIWLTAFTVALVIFLFSFIKYMSYEHNND